jgi:YVTN family beta-propeller protein
METIGRKFSLAGNWVRRATALVALSALLACVLLSARVGRAQAPTPSAALLVLEKADNSLAIVDPVTLKVVGRVPAGNDPHEIVASADGKTAYISNYGGLDSTFNTITVVDLAAQKALPPISLGTLRSPHGLTFAGGKLYFTAETSKVFGRYDPATQTIDWVLGTGQDRTHMVLVSANGEQVYTANVSSGTISIIEQVAQPMPPGPPPGGPAGAGPPPEGPRKTWKVTNVPSGRGSEGFDVSPDGGTIWAANAQDGTVTVIDVASKKATATFPVAVHGNRLKFTLDGKRVLVSGGGPGGPGGPGAAGPNFVVIDAATHKEIKQLNMGGGSGGILVAPDGTRAFVAMAGKNKVNVVDLKTLEVSGEVVTGKGPDGLAWAQGN